MSGLVGLGSGSLRKWAPGPCAQASSCYSYLYVLLHWTDSSIIKSKKGKGLLGFKPKRLEAARPRPG